MPEHNTPVAATPDIFETPLASDEWYAIGDPADPAKSRAVSKDAEHARVCHERIGSLVTRVRLVPSAAGASEAMQTLQEVANLLCEVRRIPDRGASLWSAERLEQLRERLENAIGALDLVAPRSSERGAPLTDAEVAGMIRDGLVAHHWSGDCAIPDASIFACYPAASHSVRAAYALGQSRASERGAPEVVEGPFSVCVWCDARVEWTVSEDRVAQEAHLREHSATCPEHPAVKRLAASERGGAGEVDITTRQRRAFVEAIDSMMGQPFMHLATAFGVEAYESGASMRDNSRRVANAILAALSRDGGART